VIVFTQWWLAVGDTEADQEPAATTPRTKTRKITKEADRQDAVSMSLAVRRMIAAGVAAGVLPLVHAHSFVVVMAMGGCLALLLRRWREWFAFFLTASLIALPQLWWSTSHSAVNARSFFAWEIGWDRHEENPIWFWFKNTGLFIPLIVAAILWRGKNYLIKKHILLFYLPFTLCFIVPNLIKMAPWIWDNIKVLYYWWLASAPLVALLLARLWRQGRIQRVACVLLFVCLTLAGSLDVAGIALRSVKYTIFDMAGIRFAQIVKQRTPPQSLIVHAPVHNDPVFLSGRRSLMGYPGHIWTHGLEFAQREGEIRRIYSGAADAEQLMNLYGIDYVVVGPLEKLVMRVNEPFFNRFRKIGEVGEYRLYEIKAR
jgi:hypothetical protein